MEQDSYTQLRQKLSEQYAGRRLTGETGLTSAGLGLLRRVENLELLAEESRGCCDMARLMDSLRTALEQTLRRPRGWLTVACPLGTLPAPISPGAGSRCLLNLLWLLAKYDPDRVRVALDCSCGRIQCRLGAEGRFLTGQPGPLYPMGGWPEQLPDDSLALAAAQAVIHRAGGGLVLETEPSRRGAAFWLPLGSGAENAPVPTAEELVQNRFSSLYVILGRLAEPSE